MKTHRTGPRTKLIQVRVTPMELDAIDEMAEKEGMSVSDLVRKKLLQPTLIEESAVIAAMQNLQAVACAQANLVQKSITNC